MTNITFQITNQTTIWSHGRLLILCMFIYKKILTATLTRNIISYEHLTLDFHKCKILSPEESFIAEIIRKKRAFSLVFISVFNPFCTYKTENFVYVNVYMKNDLFKTLTLFLYKFSAFPSFLQVEPKLEMYHSKLTKLINWQTGIWTKVSSC